MSSQHLTRRKKPKFLRQDTHKKKRLALVWRKPSGLQSKLLKEVAGHRIRVKIGWGSPRESRGLLRSGERPVLVSSLRDVEALKGSKNSIIILSRTLGLRKKLLLLSKIEELHLNVLNVKHEDVKKRWEALKKKPVKVEALESKISSSAAKTESSEKNVQESPKPSPQKSTVTHSKIGSQVNGV